MRKRGVSDRGPADGERLIESGFNVTFTIRLFMHVKEVGSIFRKKGESVRICGEGLPLEAYTLQGQHAIPQPH
uniref:Uncharacterized protein n=1 Tax=Panthera leo TaxID=9689 RepID=A0A8C9D8B0_PANLE